MECPSGAVEDTDATSKLLSYLITLVFAGIVGVEYLGGSMIEEYVCCVALLTLTLIIKETIYVRTMRRRQKEI